MLTRIPPHVIVWGGFGFGSAIGGGWRHVGVRVESGDHRIGFGMSATFIVFICARLICGRNRPGDSRAATFDIELRSNPDLRERTIHGLETVAVAAIPTVKYSSESFESREDAQCSICLADYQEREILRVMLTCHHYFHRVCIDVWLQKQSTCPISRLPLNQTFEVSPIYGVFQGPDRAELPRGHSNQWLLPSHWRSEGASTITKRPITLYLLTLKESDYRS